MTGYGKAETTADGRKLTVEIRAVNNRYLDLSCRYPRPFACLEDAMRAEVSAGVRRGRVELTLSCRDERERGGSLKVDGALAADYAAAARAIAEKAYLSDAAREALFVELVKSGEVVRAEAEEDDAEGLRDAVSALSREAVARLNEMREREGEKLTQDILSRVAAAEELIAEIGRRAPKVAEIYRAKLRARMEELLSGGADETRILQEAALFADRSNIDEELTRLSSHVAQFRRIVAEDGGGKKLDFLIQEFNREANTVCSKSQDEEITRTALALKCEIEKIREQVQNLE